MRVFGRLYVVRADLDPAIDRSAAGVSSHVWRDSGRRRLARPAGFLVKHAAEQDLDRLCIRRLAKLRIEARVARELERVLTATRSVRLSARTERDATS